MTCYNCGADSTWVAEPEDDPYAICCSHYGPQQVTMCCQCCPEHRQMWLERGVIIHPFKDWVIQVRKEDEGCSARTV